MSETHTLCSSGCPSNSGLRKWTRTSHNSYNGQTPHNSALNADFCNIIGDLKRDPTSCTKLVARNNSP